MSKKLTAFTLIEMMTVIAIIGILVTLTSYVLQSSQVRARDNQRITDLQTIKSSLELFYQDNRHYPATQGSPFNYLAKWQLEYDPNNTKCPQSTDKKAKPSTAFIAPYYLTSIPGDPTYKVVYTGNTGNDCTYQKYDLTYGGNTYKVGSYLYADRAIFDGSIKTPTQTYFLLAATEKGGYGSPLWNIPLLNDAFINWKDTDYSNCELVDGEYDCSSFLSGFLIGYRYHLTESHND